MGAHDRVEGAPDEVKLCFEAPLPAATSLTGRQPIANVTLLETLYNHVQYANFSGNHCSFMTKPITLNPI